MNSTPLFGPDGRFALITAALYRAVAAALGRGLMDAPVIVLVWKRVKRTESLFLALAERVRLGRYRGGWTRAALAEGAGGGRVEGSVRPDGAVAWRVLPRRFGWLMGLMPYEAAGYGSQLSHVLAEPEMVALLRDVPRARVILGPVCRMLGIDLGGSQPSAPAVVADGIVAASGRARVARAREAVDFGRIPLPRAVVAAARRQGFGKGG